MNPIHRILLAATLASASLTAQQLPVAGETAAASYLLGPDDQIDHDAGSVMSWLMGKDDRAWNHIAAAISVPFLSQHPLGVIASTSAVYDTLAPELIEEATQKSVGGPLYPPIHGLLYSPLGLLEKPQDAYLIVQLLMTLAIFAAGLGVTYLSKGTIWCPVAILVLVLFPGCRSSVDLAQNATLSVSILIWGWALGSRGRDVAGGAILGLLAFKPVWAVAFILAPVLMRKWRMAGSMAAVGLLQIALTLPVVGVQSWRDWLAVGHEASECYSVNKNWIELSRDLGGFVRRPMVDFQKPETERANPKADRLAAILLVAAIGTTIVVYLTCGGTSMTGLGAGFLLLGSFLGCYRFMYYDSMLASVGFAALFSNVSWARRQSDTEFGSWFRPFLSGPFAVLLLLLLCENIIATWGIKGRVSIEGFGREDNPPGMNWEIGFRWPWDTFLIFGLWMWLGFRFVIQRIATIFVSR